MLCKTKLGNACILPNLRNVDNNWEEKITSIKWHHRNL
jgi:hypothetical protein